MKSETEVAIQTAAWCERRLLSNSNPASALRSVELTPEDIIMSEASIAGVPQRELNVRRSRLVCRLVGRREQLSLTIPVQRSLRGRVLGFELDASFVDGVAAAETNGFFDDNDLPPWDTWIAFRAVDGWSSPVLLSWVPDELVPLVDRGIVVHMCDAFRWVEMSLLI